ncbi:MAG: SDR family NAD(P)-dependent oxidoreductase [Legionella sp.]|uniref:SDR family NAD(P)-dependent oxidoreductase n=1 Tax=Legionella sp. TaxID=459 RepID=UPI00284A8291|nr:SDR family NAD(P)-dependent oxidoreductase [Legionella sp.]
MTQRTWVILGATSIIAEKFAHIAAQTGHRLRLIGRQSEQLHLIAQDIQLRYQVPCEFFVVDMTADPEVLLAVLNKSEQELDLFIAHSDFTENDQLNPQSIHQLIQVNIQATALLINAYLNTTQTQHHLLYLSSVAACRGRAKNSLYGATKACIEVYLQGLQQAASPSQQITIARLGFIDTRQTYGRPGIFYAGPPKTCAQVCWNALHKKKRLIYYPFFWRGIMTIMSRVPFFVYKKMSSV